MLLLTLSLPLSASYTVATESPARPATSFKLTFTAFLPYLKRLNTVIIALFDAYANTVVKISFAKWQDRAPDRAVRSVALLVMVGFGEGRDRSESRPCAFGTDM